MMIRPFRTHTLVLLISVATATSRAATPAATLPQPLTLDDAIQIGLQNQKQISIARSRVDTAKARVSQAKSAWYPSIAPSYTYTQQVTTQSTPSGKQTGTFTQNVTQIGIQQTIFDMGQRELRISMSKDSAQAATFNLHDARQAVIYAISTGWYDLLRQRDLVRVAQSGVERAKATLDSTRAFVEAGTSAQKDVLQAEADYETAQVQLIQAQNDARLAQTNLRTSMGVTTQEDIVLPDNPLAEPETAEDSRPVAAYIAQALANRPDLKSAEKSIAASRRSLQIARIQAGPLIESSIGEGYRVSPDAGENRTITATVSYPLFDAGLTRAKVREAQATLAEAEQQLELTRQQIGAAVESAYLQRAAAIHSISATKAALKAAQANYDAATASQKEGVGTVLDVITAQNALVSAETNAVHAVYNFHTAEAALQRAVGISDEAATKENVS